MAAKKKPMSEEITSQMADAYYDGLRQAKQRAGLSAASAAEVTARQRAEDEANNTVPFLATEPETPPEA